MKTLIFWFLLFALCILLIPIYAALVIFDSVCGIFSKRDE
jgi:hypothetical protein